MTHHINQFKDNLQGQPEEVERFALFQISGSLGKGIKSRIKAHGCMWNSLYHGWICPLATGEEIQKIIDESKFEYSTRTVLFPKGMISTNPKIEGQRSHLDILEKQICQEEGELLIDIYGYDANLRPFDFDEPPTEENKSGIQIKFERDFHERRIDCEKKRKEIEQLRLQLSQVNENPEGKVLDHDAPLLIVDSLIQQHFQHGKHRTLQYCSNAFWQWSGIQYIELEEVEIRQIIYTFLRDAKEVSDAGYLKSFNPTKYKVDQIIDALRAVCHRRHHPTSGAIWLDESKDPDPRYLISFKNGILSIRDWLKDPTTPLISHTPVLLNVNSLTFDFDSSASTPTEWLRFLNTIWSDDIESQGVLQEWFGYILTQDTRHHKILLIVGPPRSGKGTIGRILRELLGHFNVVGPTLSSLGGEFGLQPLLNQMLALISDVRLNGKGNNSIIIERLLSISGEDPLTINRKFLPPFTVQLPTRIMMMSNELPDMRDSSGALANRYLVLTLKKSYLGNEDTSLFNRLQAELPGILLWALKGLILLQERGHFLQPSSSAQTITELGAMTSPIKAFVAEMCEIKPFAKMTVTALFNAWRVWCTNTGYPQSGNVQSFGKNLRAAFPEIEIVRSQEDQTRERYYKGIVIISTPNVSADVRGHE